MTTLVEVQIKNVYGRDLIYPHNSKAHGLAQFIGKKTFNTRDILNIKHLGFEIKYISAHNTPQ